MHSLSYVHTATYQFVWDSLRLATISNARQYEYTCTAVWQWKLWFCIDSNIHRGLVKCIPPYHDII